MFVAGISLDGILLTHRHPLGGFGSRVAISFTWLGEAVRLVGELRWTQVQRLGSAAFGRSMYQSGFATVPHDEKSAAVLNLMFRPREFVGHEYLDGEWRETRTNDPVQPPNGFKIAIAHSREEVDMLRDAYAIADSETRAIIRKMAEAVNAADRITPRSDHRRTL